MPIIATILAYNEVGTIGDIVKAVKFELRKLRLEHKILVVDDGSRDSTAEFSRKNGAIVVSHHKNAGLAETYRTELKKCL